MSILVWHTLLFSSKLSCMLRPFDAIQHYLTRETDQNFVLKVYIVITFKVFADFRFESPISIDFQSEIPTLLAPKSAKTFHESLEFFRAIQSKQSKQFNSKIILIQVEMSFLKCSDEKSSGKFKYHLVLSKSVH